MWLKIMRLSEYAFKTNYAVSAGFWVSKQVSYKKKIT